MRDFDYYIKAAEEAEKRSNMLWQHINRYILQVLQKAKAEGKSLVYAAGILERAGGKKSKNEPVAFCNLRMAAKQIKAGEELVLL